MENHEGCPSEQPIYKQIALDVAMRIANGKYQEGERIKGRSTLAGEYHTSPETIRRAIHLLHDLKIVDIRPGSGIFVLSSSAAQSFVENCRHTDNLHSIKENLAKLLDAQRLINTELEENLNTLLDYSGRFSSLSPLTPYEIKITGDCPFLGHHINELNFWQHTGATVVGIRREGTTLLSPGPYAQILEGDVYLVIGNEKCCYQAKSYLQTGQSKV